MDHDTLAAHYGLMLAHSDPSLLNALNHPLSHPTPVQQHAPEEDDEEEDEESVENSPPGTLLDGVSAASVAHQPAPMAPRPSVGKSLYVCHFPGCHKTYTTSAGLRYHKKHTSHGQPMAEHVVQHGYHAPASPSALQAAHHMHAYKQEHPLSLPMEYGAMMTPVTKPETESSDSEDTHTFSSHHSTHDNAAAFAAAAQLYQPHHLPHHPPSDHPHEAMMGGGLHPEMHPPRPPPSQNGVREYYCPVQGCSNKYHTAAGLRYHTKSIHNTTPKEAMGESSKPAIYACGVEGCTKKYTTLAGLRYHTRKGHPEMTA